MNLANTSIIAKKLHNKLKSSGWDNLLKGFTLSATFENIIEILEKRVADNYRFTPPLKQVFSMFENCPANELKVVILNDEPHNMLGLADGMAFSCSNTQKATKNLDLILSEVNRTIYDGKQISTDSDLSRWARQGVLLVNTSLTAELDKQGKHRELWSPFIAYMIDMINAKYEHVIWVLVGKNIHYEDDISKDHTILYVDAPSTYTGTWDSNDIFPHINIILENDKKTPIVW